MLWVGDQNGESVKKSGIETEKLIGKLRKKNKQVFIVGDITQIGRITLSAKKSGLDLIRNLDYDKVAVFGNPFAFQKLVETLALAAGRNFKFRFCVSLEEAMDWLLDR